MQPHRIDDIQGCFGDRRSASMLLEMLGLKGPGISFAASILELQRFAPIQPDDQTAGRLG
jgi:hypothetical protein